MMALREIALETLENYNPATDNPNSQSNIPAGEYDVVIEKAGFRIYDSGYDCVAIECKVIGGDYDGRIELININVAPDYAVNKMHKFIHQRNIKLISQLAFACGIELDDDDWEDQQSLGDAFGNRAMGAQFVLEITESPNKKDPGNPYRNYRFMKYEEDLPF